jgi:hypothetical protein
VQKSVATGVIANFQSTNTTATYTGIALRSAASIASARNWSLTMNNNAFGDFAIRTSTAIGGDPIAAGVDRLVIDASGNLGLGITPSAWASDWKTTQIGARGVLAYYATTPSTFLGLNFYYAGGSGASPTYITTGVASFYQQVNGQHVWYNAPSGTAGNAITFTQAMTLDASGNLAVGATSGNGKINAIFDNASIRLGYVNSTDRNINIRANTGYNTSITFTQEAVADRFSIGCKSGDGSLIFATGDSLANGTERMRLDSSGNLLVGATSGSFSQVVGTGSYVFGLYQTTANGNVLNIDGNYSSGTQNLIVFSTSGAYRGAVTYNGTSVQYTTSSDYRLKENVRPMQNALEKVAALKPVTYTWKENGSAGEGFIAHELQAIVPDCVTGEKDAVDADGNPKYQGIDTSFLVATLTAAIQEQQALIQSLTDRITQLEAK